LDKGGKILISKIRGFSAYFINKIKRFIRIIGYRFTKDKFEKDDLVSDIKNIGIKEGDIIFLYSSLKSIGYVKGGARTVIEAFLDVIGKKGTLIIPTYTYLGNMYKTCLREDYIFDYTKKKTDLGAIPSKFLKFKNIYRSIHPTHSCAAIGKDAEWLTSDHHIDTKTFGSKSPWARFSNKNGKMFGLGISLGPITQYHYIEDFLNGKFPLKVHTSESFRLKCKIKPKRFLEVEVKPLDPKVAKTRIDKKENKFIRHYFWTIFTKLDILKKGIIGNANSWWVNIKDFNKILIKLAELGITIYSKKKDLIKNQLYPFENIKNQFF